MHMIFIQRLSQTREYLANKYFLPFYLKTAEYALLHKNIFKNSYNEVSFTFPIYNVMSQTSIGKFLKYLISLNTQISVTYVFIIDGNSNNL